MPPSLALAADAATCLIILQSVCLAPLSMMGWSGLGTDPRKKWLPAVLCALDSDKYEASEWMLRTISDA
eukprot:7645799-Ditylum_brightwellii.AAC.1